MSCCCCIYDCIKQKIKSGIIPTMSTLFETKMLDIVNKLPLENIQKQVLIDRYISRVKEYKDQYNYNNRWNDLFKIIITIGSLAIPTMISLQQYTDNTSNANIKIIIFWISITLSFLISICNGIRELYQLDKKVIYQLETKEALVSEIWKFIELSGKYTKYPNHNAGYIYFCNKMEKILFYSNQKKILLSTKKHDDEENNTNTHNIYNMEGSPRSIQLTTTQQLL